MIEVFIETVRKKVRLSKDQCRHLEKVCRADRMEMLPAAVKSGLVSEHEVLEALGQIYEIPVVLNLSGTTTVRADTSDLSRHFLKRALIVPVRNEKKETVIAVNDPSDLSGADDTAGLLGLDRPAVVLTPKDQILAAINTLYVQSDESTRQLVEDLEGIDATAMNDFEKTADLLDDTSDAPVIRLVNQMISQSVKAGASDIHIEPFQDNLKVRYRIDGILYDLLSPPKAVQASLISRIKVMAKMNIAEKRVPQDGRAQVRIGNQEIDIRISTVPTSFGERLVMRLLNKSGYFLELSQFGMSEKNEQLINTIIRQTNGIVLVTGPTGSGKTTSLYAALSAINAPDKNIITIEDPIEYNLEGIGQIQVNPKTGVTFARGLRSIVRQDPDIILIGEVRDLETAEIAIQSALTGHLVFSTLHTNDSAGAITRLSDLGLEPYLISSSVNTVVAQRLVRVLCRHCKEAYRLAASHTKPLNGAGEDHIGERVFKPRGCPKCFQTGYLGRQAIFEIMQMTGRLKALVLETSDANRIREEALHGGMTTLRQDGMAKVMDGITSIQEVLRVTQG